MTYEEAVRQVYFWQYSNTASFHNMLCDVIMKADSHNRAKLATAFPNLVEALYNWGVAGDMGKDLFRKEGLIKDDRIEIQKQN